MWREICCESMRSGYDLGPTRIFGYASEAGAAQMTKRKRVYTLDIAGKLIMRRCHVTGTDHVMRRPASVKRAPGKMFYQRMRGPRRPLRR